MTRRGMICYPARPLKPKHLHPHRHQINVRSESGRLKEKSKMNNLHRELAPISDAAWAQIQEETSRTLKRYLAARRVANGGGPAGSDTSAARPRHLRTRA